MKKLKIFLIAIVIILILTTVSCVNAVNRDTESYIKEKAAEIGDIKIGGYNEQEREKIFLELLDLEKKAEKEATEKYPLKKSDPNYLEDNFSKYMEYKKELTTKYSEELTKKYNLSLDQISIIKSEGYEKDWYQHD